MRSNNRRRLIHRDCWPFSELFLSRRGTAVTRRRGGRPPEPAARPRVEPDKQCDFLQLRRETQTKYSLPLILISVNNTESGIKPAQNITHLCQQAWENVSTVKVALRENTTLQIVPMSIDGSCHPQIVAIAVSDVISKGNSTRPYAQEEMTNVTCLVNTWEEETHKHVFTVPLSSTLGGAVCAENIQATRTVSSTPDGTVCPTKTHATWTPNSTLFTREKMALTTRQPKIKTTRLTLNHRTSTCSPCPNETVKERSPHVAIIIMETVIGVVLVELLVAYIIRRQWCCSLGDQQGHLAGANSTPPNRTTQQSGEQQYSEIPDEYYDQQNTATSTTSQTDHDYSQIPDGYFNYYNTRPGAQHQDGKDYSVRFNTAAAEVAILSSTRRGCKHPSYNTAPQVCRDPQNYQIPAQGRRTNIRTPRMPETGSSGHQYMGLLGNCRHSRRPLSYPQAVRVPQDDNDYSVRFNTAAAEVVVPSSTRLGDKHPSYETAPQVWRDPQNYQIPAQGRNTNIRSQRIPVARSSSEPRYMGLIGSQGTWQQQLVSPPKP
ncbi:PREDICTED: uncharacterized protein LOC109479477 [Branchiostoma belcheri]|uniref:Uncharacterized protein LOC109479477 n=1 Tax=Branchiostoma belcheri TaxID=7741 RepID=A0A6P4ZSD3_BRABE|nr:PREDICTED: uncharacterized protein LOC109479477 [Branchiostoma belcheri]